MSELSFVAFVLTFGPIIILSSLLPLVELKTLYYGLSLSNMFFGTVAFPRIIVSQVHTRWTSEGIMIKQTSSTSSRISKAEAKEIAAAALLLRAEGPVQVKNQFKLVASGFKFGAGRTNKRWYAIASRGGLMTKSRVVVYHSNLTGLMWAGYREGEKVVLVDTINWN